MKAFFGTRHIEQNFPRYDLGNPLKSGQGLRSLVHNPFSYSGHRSVLVTGAKKKLKKGYQKFTRVCRSRSLLVSTLVSGWNSFTVGGKKRFTLRKCLNEFQPFWREFNPSVRISQELTVEKTYVIVCGINETVVFIGLTLPVDCQRMGRRF